MKKKNIKIFLVLLLLLISFFSNFDVVYGNNILTGMDLDYLVDKKVYDTAKANIKNGQVDNNLGGSNDGFFDMCFYPLWPGSNLDEFGETFETVTLDKKSFGYALISFNPDITNNSQGTFRFSYGFYMKDTKTYYMQGEITNYYLFSQRFVDISADALETENDYNDGAPYVRFANDTVVTNLKKGICPSTADFTSEGFVDSNYNKRICFGDSDGCNFLGNAWDDYQKNYSFSGLPFSHCNYGNTDLKSPIYCMARYIEADSKLISGIDATNTAYCVPGAFASHVNDTVLKGLNNAMTNVAKSDRESFVGKFNLYNIREDTGRMEPGLNIYNYRKDVNKLVDAYNGKIDQIASACDAAGIIDEDDWKKQTSELMISYVERINNANSTNFGTVIDGCSDIQGTKFYELLQYAFTGIKVATPVLVLVLISKDVVAAVASAKEDDMKKAQKNAVIRLIVGVCIFLLPTLVNVIISYVDKISGGSCGIS